MRLCPHQYVRGLATILIIVVVVAIASITPSHVFADDGIHGHINFQGKLTNPDGSNVDDGSNYELVFRLYATDTGGSALWTETHADVTVTDGVFRVSLGSQTSLSSVNFNSDSLYLSIQVTEDATGSATGDDEMDPRMRFSAVPYAFNAEKVNGLTVTNTSDTAFSSTTTLKIGDGKTVVFNEGLTLSVASDTDGKEFIFPAISGASGTVVIEDFAQTLTNKTIGSSGLTFSGAVTDITTATDEDLVITAGGTGNIIFGVDGDTTVSMAFAVAPDSDMFSITNTSGAVTATGVDGLFINYATGGTTASNDNAALRVSVTSNNSGVSTTLEGIYVESLTSPEANATETAVKIGTGWDVGVSIESGGISITGGGITLTDAGALTLAGSSRRSKSILLSAEYPGGVLYGDGSNNTGVLTSDYENNTTDGSGQRMTYYEWNGTSGSGTDNDYDIIVRFRIPDDFSAWSSGTPVTFHFETETTTLGLNSVDYSIFAQGDTVADATDTGNVSGSAGTWVTTSDITTASLTSCTGAGTYCSIHIHMISENSNYVRVGDIQLNYLASY